MRLGLALGLGEGINLIQPWTMASCAAWYEADYGVATSGANITGWTGRGAGGHNLVINAASPTLVASAYKGNPTARFVTASNQSMKKDAVNLFGTGAHSIYAIVKPTVGANNCGVGGSWTAAGGVGLYMNGSNRTVLHAGVAAFDDGVHANALELWTEIRVAAAKPSFYLNKVLQTLSGASTTMVDAGGTAKLTVGEGNGNGTSFDGDIAAIGFFTTNHDATTQAIIETYLTNKYI